MRDAGARETGTKKKGQIGREKQKKIFNRRKVKRIKEKGLNEQKRTQGNKHRKKTFKADGLLSQRQKQDARRGEKSNDKRTGPKSITPERLRMGGGSSKVKGRRKQPKEKAIRARSKLP